MRFCLSPAGVKFPPGFSGCKPAGCPVPCTPPTCSIACSTGIPCSPPAIIQPVAPTPQVIVGPTIPAIPVSYPAPPVYAPAPAPYPPPPPMPSQPACPAQCLRHAPQFCPSYCGQSCCKSSFPSYTGKKTEVERPKSIKSFPKERRASQKT